MIGIDLGTTNSAVAYVERSAGRRSAMPRPARVRGAAARRAGRRAAAARAAVVPVSRRRRTSARPGRSRSPWDADADPVGVFAREHGALVPSRQVASAKSWLAYGGVDRTAAILPFGHEPGDAGRLAGRRPRRATWRTCATRGTPRGRRGNADAALRGTADRAHRARVVRRRGARADDCRGDARRARRTSR